MSPDMLFCDYFSDWIETYKHGAVRDTTYTKYRMAETWVKSLLPDIRCGDLTKHEYQQLINRYAETHEKQTTTDFHHQVKAAILDAVDEGLIPRDPTRKIAFKGKKAAEKEAEIFE